MQDIEKINAFAMAMLEQADLDDLLWSIAKCAGETIGFDDCVIYLRKGDVLVQMAAFGIKNPKDRQLLARIEIPVGSGIVGTVAETGIAEIVSDTEADPRYIQDQFSGLSELTVPVIYEGKTIAVIDSESLVKNGFSESERDLLQVIANIASPRIASAKYYRTLQATQMQLTRSNKDLEAKMADLEHNQQSLVQSEKMASVGLLAAGIAHEINNPLGFSLSNLSTLKEYIHEIREARKKIVDNPNIPEEHKYPLNNEDISYILDDLVELVNETTDGLISAKNIMSDLRNFARTGYEAFGFSDINEGLKTALNVLRNELKYHCEIFLELAELPEVFGDIGKLNQVFMNIILNASQACKESVIITIRTYADGNGVYIEIEDNGPGIPEENKTDIFSPFFTTKPVGQGTGLGLSISYKIICEDHAGRIDVESSKTGTMFRIFLPQVNLPKRRVEEMTLI